LEPYEELSENLTLEVFSAKTGLTLEPGKLKPRVFSMIDSLRQSVLSPLHDDLMNILRNIPEDCTHDQNKVTGYAKY
jgi:hypothetical protein